MTSFSKLSSNTSKYEIAGIGSLKLGETVVCGMKNIDLTKDVVKMIRIVSLTLKIFKMN